MITHQYCARCGLMIRPRASYLTSEHCPRCLGRDRLAIPMLAMQAGGSPEAERSRTDSDGWPDETRE